MAMAEPSFSLWLIRMATRAGAVGASEVRALLARHGCPCSAEAVELWLAGESEPGPDKRRAVIRALAAALPQVDVWDDYASYLEGGGPAPDKPPPDTLEDILKKNPGLPPGL